MLELTETLIRAAARAATGSEQVRADLLLHECI